MKPRTLPAAAASALLALAVSWTPSAGAAPATGNDRAEEISPHVAVHQAATRAAEHQRIVDYWTPQRMRNAVPGARLVTHRDTSSAGGHVAAGAPEVIRPHDKPDDPGGNGQGNGNDGGAEGETGEYYTGGGQIVDTTGKVFFTLNGTNYVCSGSSTTSNNHDLVLTAGHCVNEGPGAYATNFAFVPAYDDGARPYGTFTARSLVTTTQWKNSGDFDYDIGFAVMNPLDGQDLTETVGSQGIGFNLARGEHMYAFGYPAAKRYDGSDVAWCHGTVFADTYGGSQDQGMDCNMTGGSSGGPWLINYSESSGVGTLNSLNSFGYRGVNDVMWGPYFGSVAQDLYQTAQGL